MSLNNSPEITGTREHYKQVKKKKQKDAQGSVRRRSIRVRLIPIWLRVIIVALLIVLFVLFGAVFGYSVMGNGEFQEVFQSSTWMHIKDLVVKE